MTIPVDRLTDVQVVAVTLFGEARSEGPEGRIAVANVIRNRVACQRTSFGLTPREVCLKPKQFSCWIVGGGALNYGVIQDTALLLSRGERPGPVLRECLWIAQGLLDAAFVDSTHGSSHYLTRDLYATRPPTWAINRPLLAHIGNHVFLRAL